MYIDKRLTTVSTNGQQTEARVKAKTARCNLQNVEPLLRGSGAYWFVIESSSRSSNWAYLRLYFGIFRHVYNHAPGDCFLLPKIVDGSEDIQVLPNGLAFISSGLTFTAAQNPDKIGRIYLFDFNNPKADPVELKIIGEEKYKKIYPHGIYIWTDPKTGTVLLYVVNHTPEGEAVDKFRFHEKEKTLEHLRRIDNQADFHVVNDLTVVAEDQFYYTNWIYSLATKMFELYLTPRWGSVGFFNGTTATILDRNLFIPNGVVITPDQKTVYVAHLGDEDLRVYRRNPDNSLSFLQSIYTGTLPDNLDLDRETGDIWIGAHPRYNELLKYLGDVTYKTPSQALRVRFPKSSSSAPEITEVYSNDGTQMAASTVAVKYKNGMLIGSIYTRALYCQIDYI